MQRYLCKDCKSIFTSSNANTTYSINLILNSISNYNLGYNLKQTSTKIEKDYKIKAPISTISSWITQYKNICTFARLRKEAIKHYMHENRRFSALRKVDPKNIISKKALSHIQPYTFKYHKAKLGISIKENPKFTT
ncbi:MAG: hypothetical protein IH819_09475, partial [Bacteroidetes bacterium]|nr:hypothetical protein [Bacteroidota bacterium]